jgi:hypothetical protein
MIAIAAMRNYQKTRARLVLTALVVGWANFILQPCVMAAPQQISAPVVYSSHSAHTPNDNLTTAGSSDVCPHCGEEECAGNFACDDSATVNSKSAFSTAEFTKAMSHVPGQAWPDDFVYSQCAACRFIPPPKAHPSPVPLTILNCVFLK